MPKKWSLAVAASFSDSVTQLLLTAVSGCCRSGSLKGELRIGQVFIGQLRGLEKWLNGSGDQSLFPSTTLGILL